MPDVPVQPVLLIVDDDPGVRGMLERVGRAAGFRVDSCAGGREAVARLADWQADAALVDLKMPDVGGLEVLRAIRQAQPDCQVILMTGYATVETAIEAVKLGALDYLSKPLPLDRLKALLASVHADIDRRRALLAADHRTARELEMCRMIGRGPRMQELFALVRRLAPHFRVALVVGETGVGKELVARALHQLGPRGRRRFVTVNCSAVVETLFESELFGHVKGAFTGADATKVGLFESADGGTLFLDEIGELPLSLQAKLLRAIETGEVQRVGSLEPRKVDVLVIAATNRDLTADVEAGRFRRDLLYRLNVVEISPPPLRDRREDIPYLTAAFLDTSRARCGVLVDGLSPAAEALLMRHDWPGN
ncbi:MAG: sigma-54-dependent Fis family transcriptional regulator, partial [Acidobacteria bacterium]|nr:sigma-54-dependent Fis family transcriptional regulator [Acidobacteriota bacterium]